MKTQKNQTVYVHIENLEIVGVSSNPAIALKFVTGSPSRSVKDFPLQTKVRSNGKLSMKRGRKTGSKNPKEASQETTKKIRKNKKKLRSN